MVGEEELSGVVRGPDLPQPPVRLFGVELRGVDGVVGVVEVAPKLQRTKERLVKIEKWK